MPWTLNPFARLEIGRVCLHSSIKKVEKQPIILQPFILLIFEQLNSIFNIKDLKDIELV